MCCDIICRAANQVGTERYIGSIRQILWQIKLKHTCISPGMKPKQKSTKKLGKPKQFTSTNSISLYHWLCLGLFTHGLTTDKYLSYHKNTNKKVATTIETQENKFSVLEQACQALNVSPDQKFR